MLELYIPRKYYRHEGVAQNVNPLKLSFPNLNAKYIPEILDWQNNSPQISDQFHSTNHNSSKKSIYHDKNRIYLANNNISPKIKELNWNKKVQSSKSNSIAGKKEIFDHNYWPFHIIIGTYILVLLFDYILIP